MGLEQAAITACQARGYLSTAERRYLVTSHVCEQLTQSYDVKAEEHVSNQRHLGACKSVVL